MADMLATVEDLAAALQVDPASLNTAAATLALESATSAVQDAAGGQRIVLVTDDVLEREGEPGEYLQLPQIPVVSVASVTIDGKPVTDWKLVGGGRLKRECGWRGSLVIIYTHGYPSTDQGIQSGRSFTLSLAKAGYSNPEANGTESVDGYSASLDSTSARGELTRYAAAAIRNRYGRKAGVVG